MGRGFEFDEGHTRCTGCSSDSPSACSSPVSRKNSESDVWLVFETERRSFGETDVASAIMAAEVPNIRPGRPPVYP